MYPNSKRLAVFGAAGVELLLVDGVCALGGAALEDVAEEEGALLGPALAEGICVMVGKAEDGAARLELGKALGDIEDEIGPLAPLIVN